MQNYKIKEENAENLGYTPPSPPPRKYYFTWNHMLGSI